MITESAVVFVHLFFYFLFFVFLYFSFFFNDTATTEIYTLSLHDALPICGVASFIFMIFPLSFLILWMVKTKNPESLNKKYLFNLLIFYLTWFFSGILFSLIVGFSFSSIIGRFFLGTSSLVAGTVLLFSVIDYLLILKRKILKGREKYRICFSFIATFFLGVLLLGMVKGEIGRAHV